MIKPPLLTFCFVFALFSAVPIHAGQVASTSVPNSVQGIAEREVIRRNEQVSRAQQAIAEGDKAMAVKDYEVAVQQYKAAADILPESPVTHKLRSAAVDRYCDASIKLAEQQIAEGNFAQAEVTAKAVLAPGYDPDCSGAKSLLAHLEEPGYYNKTITPKFHAKVEQVKAWMVDARGYYESGQYEKAMMRYDQILGIDPTNVAARQGQIEVDQARTQYADKAYAETRARALWKVANAWGQPIRKYNAKNGTIIGNPQPASSTAAIQNKLNTIIVPKVEFKDATVREAIDFLKLKSRELDVREADPSRRGVNIVLQLDNPMAAPVAPASGVPADAAGAAPAIPSLDTAATPAIPGALPAAGAAATAPAINPADARITLSLNNVPLAEVLRYITTLAGLKIKIDPYAVAVVPLTVVVETLITKEYKVPPGTFTNASGAAAAGAAAPVAVAAAGGPTSTPLAGHVPAKEYFTNLGVQFPLGSSATFISTSSRLIVKNTQEQLDLIDTLVEALNGAVPSQVDIEAKFVEITQNNLKELSFDWTLGQFSIPGSNKIFGGGGTMGNTSTKNASDFGFVDPTTGTPVGTSNSGSGLITSANRTGIGALSANAIDSLLFPAANTTTSAAPAIFSIAGVFSDPQFQVAIRALNQKKGVDLLSSPRVTCKSGQEAEIEIIRDFIYPSTFTPPALTSGSGGVGATPATPQDWKTEKVGVLLHVQPTVSADGTTIDLQLEPKVEDFDGFINYGTPMYGPGGTLLTANVINQPIFSSRRVRTSVSIWDGQTVMLGGLMREDVQKVEDKVPFLGDVPLLGRLFRSSVDQHTKRNLVIFVTARLINPAGDAINVSDDEKDDTVEPPPAALPGAADATAPLLLAPLPTK